MNTARIIPLYDAKTQFSQIVEEVLGTGTEVTVSRHGKPVVKIVPFASPAKFLLGGLEDMKVADDFDAPDPEIIQMFEGGDL
jgi:prevent-host-death family protein